MNTWLSYLTHMPASAMIMIGLMTTASTLVIADALKKASVRNKLEVKTVESVHLARSATPAPAVSFIQLRVLLHNHADDPIFVDFDVLNFSLQGRSDSEAKNSGGITRLLPGTDHSFLLPSIKDVSDGDVSGTLRLRLSYGKHSNRLTVIEELEYRLLGSIYEDEISKRGVFSLNSLLVRFVSK